LLCNNETQGLYAPSVLFLHHEVWRSDVRKSWADGTHAYRNSHFFRVSM